MKTVCVLCLFCLLITSSVLASDAEMDALFKEHCSTACHDLTFTCMTLGQKSEAAWKLTIKRMNTRGGDFPEERMDDGASYLAGLEPGQGVCK